MVKNNCFMKKNYARIEINTDDNLPLNKQLKFSTLTLIIRWVLQNGVDINKTKASKECKFVIIGTLKILILSMNHIFAMIVMV